MTTKEKGKPSEAWQGQQFTAMKFLNINRLNFQNALS